MPLLLGVVVDAIAEKDMDKIREYCINWMIPIVAGSAIFTWVRGTTFNTMGEKIAKEIRYDLFYFTINKDVGFFDENKTGAILSRISADTSIIQEGLGMNISMLLRNLIQLICAIALMCLLSPKLTAALFITLMPVMGMIGYVLGYLREHTKA